ncbi:cytochrome P450 [Mycobacterium hackensackense]|uniref:cytochrome P450 n=1 Tax=Mycobacterium hackensackense TaxID=228909 RepID=UPI002265F12D|nr:cytochrome P450 [Mycobacterium hackensackense]MCV7256880.1 cytochrome P450 [Mycobacterium hackensackense]
MSQPPDKFACPASGQGSISMTARLNPFSPDYLADPYPVFEAARAEARAFYSEELDYWILTRYDDVKQVIRDTVNFSSDLVTTPLEPFGPVVMEELSKVGFQPVRVLADNDPPGHARARRQVNKAFNPRRIKLMEQPVRELARRQIDRIADQVEVDFVSALAQPLPALVLFRLFGLPDDYLDVVKKGSADRVYLMTGRPEEAASRVAGQGLARFYTLCRDLIADRIADPREDFPSDLIRAGQETDEPLTERELVQVMYSILFAGDETTSSHLTHLVHRVLLVPGLWRRLHEQPGLIPNTVEEALRVEAPVINWRRRAKVDVEVGGVSLPAGAKILLSLGSANHDEATFDEAESFQPERSNARAHLTFGFGEHICLGAPLARLEGRVVLEEMVDRFPDATLPDQELDYPASVLFRTLTALRIRLY